MRPVKIITDSCSDLTGELLDKYNIDYAKMNTVYQGNTTQADLRWTKEDAHKFYDTIRKGERITTTQVPVEEFNIIFKKYLEEGYDIVYIGCSTKQSGSVNTATVVAKQFMEQYPDAKIFCIDSYNASFGEGILAIEAAKKVVEGMSAEDINSYIISIRKTVNQFITVHSLDSLKKAGRVKASAAFFGNLMGVKPILISDFNGVQTPIKKAKGRENSMKEIVQLLKDVILDAEKQTVYIVHADCSEEEVTKLKTMVAAEIPCKEVLPLYIGPIIGASIGPDAIGLFAFGKEVTYAVGE